VFWSRFYEGGSYLSAGRIDRAEDIYRTILQDPPRSPIVREARTMYALSMLRRGDFVALEDFARQNADELDIFRISGDVHRLNAHWDVARDLYRQGLARAEADRRIGLVHLFRAELALVDGWTGRHDPTQWTARTADDFVGAWSVVSGYIGQALFHVTTDVERARESLALADEVAATFGLREASADVVVARAFLAAVHGDAAELSRMSATLEEWTTSSGTYASWLQVVRLWETGTPLSDGAVHWVAGAGEAWRDTLSARQAPR
jgi:hypothetical protein